MLNQRATAALACLAIDLVLLGGCTVSGADTAGPGVVSIGMLADTTSDAAAAGQEAVHGAELAVTIVNGAHPDIGLPLAPWTGLPGLRGARLRLAVGDTTGTVSGADSAVRALVADGRAAAVVLADNAAAVETAGSYADRQQIPMVDACAAADYLTDIGLDWYFRTTPTSRTLTEAALALIPARAGTDGGDRITVFTPGRNSTSDSGNDIQTLVAELGTAAGFEVTDPVRAHADAAARLAARDPDVVIAAAPTAADGQRLAHVLADLSPSRAVIGIGPGFTVDTSPDGLLRAAPWSAEFAGRQPVARAVAELYRSTFDAAMTETAAGAFTATMTLAQAIDAAGAADPAAVRTALRQLSLPAAQTIMPWTGVRFGEDGQNQLATAVVEQLTDGTARLVHPREIATADVVWTASPAKSTSVDGTPP